MKIHSTLAAAAATLLLISATGCAVGRGQQTTGAYIDDAGITTAIKGHLLDNPDVAGTSISVETLNGTVMLSGFAKSQNEKTVAGNIATKTAGVKSVKNEIAVRP
jgi:osmotically-inducible protein OsmY